MLSKRKRDEAAIVSSSPRLRAAITGLRHIRSALDEPSASFTAPPSTYLNPQGSFSHRAFSSVQHSLAPKRRHETAAAAASSSSPAAAAADSPAAKKQRGSNEDEERKEEKNRSAAAAAAAASIAAVAPLPSRPTHAAAVAAVAAAAATALEVDRWKTGVLKAAHAAKRELSADNYYGQRDADGRPHGMGVRLASNGDVIAEQCGKWNRALFVSHQWVWRGYLPKGAPFNETGETSLCFCAR